MKEAVLILDKNYILSDVDRRIFGSFVEHMGRAVYGGIYDPSGGVCDEEGFRTDVLDMVRELQVPVVRYPGGNFVSAYRWEDSVGPKELRPVRADPAWKSTETNEFGLNEFIDWCRKAGAEPMLAVNLGTRGMGAARNELEYCNFPGGTYYSDLRRRHGWKEPHGVKLWCLGNEMDGPWQIGQKKAADYGYLAGQTARLMKSVDSDIELVACGSSTATMSTFGSWEMGVLKECYDDIDYISMHNYFGKFTGSTGDLLGCSVEMDRFINECTALCDAVKVIRHSSKTINISFDEWNVNYHYKMSQSDPENWKEWYLSSANYEEFYSRQKASLPKDPPYDWEQAPHRGEDIYTMEDALAVGELLITLLKHADRVKIACQAQLVNVLAPIMTSGDRAVRQTIFYPYMDVSRYGRGKVLETVIKSPVYESRIYGDVTCIDAVAVLEEAEEALAVFAVNRCAEDIILYSDMRQFENWHVAWHKVMSDDDLMMTDTFEHPERVMPRYAQGDACIEEGRLKVRLEKYSWNVIYMQSSHSSGI